ncbi:MAG: FAD-dependent oxidoreductase [Bacteroidota bacterium]
MISLWEQQSFQYYDVVVVGAGISGLSAAASLVERDPELKVLVVERRTLPSGASTRNAGFACFGSLTELLADVEAIGWDGMLQLVERRWLGLEKTRARLGTKAIDLQVKGGWELLHESATGYQDQMEQVNQQLFSLFRAPVFMDRSSDLGGMGFSGFRGLLFNRFEGQLDTGRLVKHLWQYCTSKGVVVLTGTEVQEIDAEAKHVRIVTPDLVFACRQAIICTNAFTPHLLDVDLVPGRGTVIVVEPEGELPFEGTFHYDEGYFYFRDYYGKLIFGGGRNIDKEAEATTSFEINPDILQRLKQDLEEKILPLSPYKITHQWSGIMAFGDNKQPVVQQVNDRVSMGVRLGGMGVAVGSMVGEELARLAMTSVR